MKWGRSRTTYANVAATLALALAISGGAAVALQDKNTVFSDDIVNGEVKGGDVAEKTLGKVPNAGRLNGAKASAFARSRNFRVFNVTLNFGETKTVLDAGTLKYRARCLENQGGDDTLSMFIVTTQNGAVFSSDGDKKVGGATPVDFLNQNTPVTDREVSFLTIATGTPYGEAMADGAGYGTTAASPNGTRILMSDGDVVQGLNLFGKDCFVSGTAVVLP
jgi:hypothetical protein